MNSFWVFAVIADDPIRLAKALRAGGYDATLGGTSLAAVMPTDAAAPRPRRVIEALEKFVYVPAYAEVPRPKLERLASLITEASVEKVPSTAATEATARSRPRRR